MGVPFGTLDLNEARTRMRLFAALLTVALLGVALGGCVSKNNDRLVTRIFTGPEVWTVKNVGTETIVNVALYPTREEGDGLAFPDEVSPGSKLPISFAQLGGICEYDIAFDVRDGAGHLFPFHYEGVDTCDPLNNPFPLDTSY